MCSGTSSCGRATMPSGKSGKSRTTRSGIASQSTAARSRRLQAPLSRAERDADEVAGPRDDVDAVRQPGGDVHAGRALDLVALVAEHDLACEGRDRLDDGELRRVVLVRLAA